MCDPPPHNTHIIVTVASDGISFRQPHWIILLTHNEPMWLTHTPGPILGYSKAQILTGTLSLTWFCFHELGPRYNYLQL